MLIITLRKIDYYLCEIKFWEGPFTITKKYRQELDNKINSFRFPLPPEATMPLEAVYIFLIKGKCVF